VLCNSTYRRLIGAALPGPLVGRPYREVLDAWVDQIDFEDGEAEKRFRYERLDRRLNEATTTFDVRLRDGRSLRVMDRRTPEGGIVKTIWDLTEDEQRAVELREARAAAEAGSSAKSDFLSSMSHELRTPLNAILGFAQLLRRDKKEPLSGRHEERVEHILKGGEHLLRLIDDILDLSRIEAGAVSISNEPVEVAEVVAEVVRGLEPMATRHAIRMRTEHAADAASMVEADRTRLMQILMNFGSNAIKYNRPEGTVTFAVTAHGGRARIVIRDSGYGIPVDKQDKLFQPFQRAGQETGPIEGTGIGLVISKRLAALMNGDVGFESGADGSSFWVELPTFQRPALARGVVPSREPRAPALPGHTQREILYVEDNPANVAFMRDLVSAFDRVALLVAPTAEMGVELARARHPSLILMDINLPGMSGVDALRELRAIPETAAIPIVALTAAASPRDREQGMREGFHRYLTKPVKVDELMTVIEDIFAAER
jgi:signal transduction histidine kinase/CheY-like chemotaxis protein